MLRESACWLLLLLTLVIMPLLRAASVDAAGWFGPAATAMLLFWTSFAPSFVAGWLAVAVGGPSKRERVASLLGRWLPVGLCLGALTVIVALLTFRLARGLPLTPYLHYQAGGGFFSPRHAVPAHVQALLLVAGSGLGCSSALSLWWRLRRSMSWRTARFVALCWLLAAVASAVLMTRAGAPVSKVAVFSIFSATFSLGLIAAVGLSACALFDSEREPTLVHSATLASAVAVAVLLLEATVNPLRIFW